MWDHNQNIALVLFSIFMLVGHSTRETQFIIFPGCSELAIHKDWNGGESIPEPIPLNPRGGVCSVWISPPKGTEAKTSVWLAGTDPFDQSSGNRKNQDYLVTLHIMGVGSEKTLQPWLWKHCVQFTNPTESFQTISMYATIKTNISNGHVSYRVLQLIMWVMQMSFWKLSEWILAEQS